MEKLTKKQKQQILRFQKIVLEKNKSMNLISRKAPQKQWELLLKQGLLTAELLNSVLNSFQAEVLDIGSGNGFPGILFSLLFPQKSFYLCERVRKKAEFLKRIKHELSLTNVQILCLPAEALDRSFDLVLSQASLPLEKMIKLLQKILSCQGRAFLCHSESWNKNNPSFSQIEIEVFKTYQIDKTTKALLKAQKSKADAETV